MFSCSAGKESNIVLCQCVDTDEKKKEIIKRLQEGDVLFPIGLWLGYESRLGGHIKMGLRSDKSILYIKEYYYRNGFEVDNDRSTLKLNKLPVSKDSIQSILDYCHHNCIVNFKSSKEMTLVGIYSPQTDSCTFPSVSYYRLGLVRNLENSLFKKIDTKESVEFLNDSIFITR